MKKRVGRGRDVPRRVGRLRGDERPGNRFDYAKHASTRVDNVQRAPAPHKYAQCVSICPDYVRRVLSIVTNWANAAAPHALDAFKQYRDALGVVSMLHDASDVVAMLHDALDVVAVVRHALGVVATLCNALGVPAA